MKTLVLKILCICTIPLIKLQNFRKSKTEIRHHRKPNTIACAFCHRYIENTPKGPGNMIAAKINVK